jgi:nucleoside-diphosphate-sugar epimerase
VGEVFICASRHPISIEAFIRQAGRCYGVENRFVRLPVAPVMALAVACERMSRWLRIPPPLDPRRVAFFTKDRAFDTTKMSRLLGFSLRRDDRTGIEDTARWYVEAGWIRPRPWMRR